MKKISIICFIVAVTSTSCYEDKGNYDYTPMAPVIVEGIDDNYIRYASEDQLNITPRIENEDKYDFCWEIYEYVNKGAELIVADTLALTKDLNVKFNFQMKPGRYLMAFKARDKVSGYTEIVESVLSVITVNMIGWYFTKQLDDEVDIDFYYDEGEVRDWMSTQNAGYRIGGNLRKTVLVRDYKERPTDAGMQRAIMTLTDRDIAIFRVEDGGLSKTFDNDMFFSVPESRNVQTCFFNQGFNDLYLVINGEIYTMYLGTLTAGGLIPLPPLPKGNFISKHGVQGFNPFFFEENSKSFKMLNYGSYQSLAERSDAPLSCSNMNADVVWMEGYKAPRAHTLAIMKTLDTPSKYILLNMNTGNTYIMGGNNPIILADVLPADSKLTAAQARGGHFDLAMIYFAYGSDVYRYDVNGKTETLLFSVPVGETITMVQHVKYPLQPQAGADYLNTLAVASYKDGKYKIWLHDVATTGDLKQPSATPNYQGTGLVKSTVYLEETDGSSIYY